MLEAGYSIGAAVELLAKSLLASLSPLLLLPATNVGADTIQKYVGVASRAGPALDIGKVKSLEAGACITRVTALGIGPLWTPQDTSSVLEVRNAAAHLGLVERSALKAAMKPMVRFSEHVRERNEINPDMRWGTHEAGRIAAKILSDELTEWEWNYHAKVNAARDRFHSSWGNLPDIYVEELLRARQDWTPAGGEYAEQSTCPDVVIRAGPTDPQMTGALR
ncbi:hypothetical protein V9L18_16035 [Pseudarthrobacter sp. CCNWLW217]